MTHTCVCVIYPMVCECDLHCGVFNMYVYVEMKGKIPHVDTVSLFAAEDRKLYFYEMQVCTDAHA